MFNIVVITVALGFFAAALKGWVLSVLWEWFLVPVGLPSITITTALGITIIFGMLTQHLTDRTQAEAKETDPTHTLVDAIIKSFLGPLVTLAIGWIITLFM